MSTSPLTPPLWQYQVMAAAFIALPLLILWMFGALGNWRSVALVVLPDATAPVIAAELSEAEYGSASTRGRTTHRRVVKVQYRYEVNGAAYSGVAYGNPSPETADDAIAPSVRYATWVPSVGLPPGLRGDRRPWGFGHNFMLLFLGLGLYLQGYCLFKALGRIRPRAQVNGD
ncbi:MAG: hypothetical protein PF961_21435 [Planctomycetota bacterium]|jgi:hypothetical protein|nr:hypothetical protein [Planctomycetota bacterium]